MYPPHHIYCVCDDDARGVSVTNHRVAALSWDPNISPPSRHCLTLNEILLISLLSLYISRELGPKHSASFSSLSYSSSYLLLLMLFLLSYIILGTFHPLLVIVGTRTFTFHLVSCTTPFSIALCLKTSPLRFGDVPSTEVHKVVHPISTTGKWDKIPALQMLSGFGNESQFSSSLKSSVGCCRDSGIEASLHLWTDVVSDWSQFSGFHGKSLRGRTRVSRKQFHSLATWMQTMHSANGFQTGFIETPRNLRTLCLCDL